MHLDYDENGKYSKNRVPLVDLKRVMTEWQDKMYENDGWNSLYWSNHDQARAVSRFGNDSEKYRVISAKMLGTCLHMMQGTPYVYEGEELGMTNADFTEISEYRDLEALDIYKDFTERKGMSSEYILDCLQRKSRDNARTPMQWDDSANAGFTTGTPWIRTTGNYKTINAKACLPDKDSVFYYYQKLIRLRHELPVITDGRYELVDAETEGSGMQYAVTTNGSAIYELGSRKCLWENPMDRKDTFDILSYSEKKDMFPFLFIDGRGYADEVTLSNDEDGVAVVLERIASII